MSFGGSTPTIFWLSVLGLYLELLLIRWIGTEVRIFAYLQNMILVVCFLGLGAGLFSSRSSGNARRMLAALAALTVLLVIPSTRTAFANISVGLAVFSGINPWGNSTYQLPPIEAAAIGIASMALTVLLLIALVEVFVPLGRWLGRTIDEAPNPLAAYSVNVAGSLVGTLLFVALSVSSQPPWVWFVVLAALLIPIARKDAGSAALVAALGLAPGVGAWLEGADETVWSPYQKLVLTAPREELRGPETWEILVNNTGYQGMFDLSPSHVAAHPEWFDPELAGLSQYDVPLLLHPHPNRVLVVGAGSGNDVAGALRNGAQEVTAVEIDPVILEFGRRLHPERPYADPRVHPVIDDARSFFATTTQTFDVIIFGLLDSHTTTSMTNARLDHYVYTQESIDRVAKLLAPGGVIVLSFEAFKPFLRERMYNTLTQSFGHPPETFRIPFGAYGWGGVLFVTGDAAVVKAQLAGNARLAAQIERWQASSPPPIGDTAPATDDWPYLYLPNRSFPPLYLALAGVALLLVAYLRLAFGIREGLDPRSWTRTEGHFAAMGAAFLLLEVQNISKASVVLGNTWDVNAVIITGVMVMVLVANFLTPYVRAVPTSAIYVVLLTIIGGLYLIDIAQFAFLPYVVKAPLIGALTTLPMLFSGVIFARSFTGAAAKDRALGANLVGALFGALLQTLSFVLGLKALLLLVAAFYALSWALWPRPTSASDAPVAT